MPADKISEKSPVILWFRYDLRLKDHAGVNAALNHGGAVTPLFIWDEGARGRALGAASKWWLHRSLKSLDEDLRRRGSRLIIAKGHAGIILPSICKEISAKTIICSRVFNPETEDDDDQLGHDLGHIGVDLKRLNTTHLSLPSELKTQENKPFRVFTPFYKALLASGQAYVDRMPEPSTCMWRSPLAWPHTENIEALDLNPRLTASGKDWAAGFTKFNPGESGAQAALSRFIAHGLFSYEKGRDRPDLDVTSHLSPHLRFGEISPRRIIHDVDKAAERQPELKPGAEKFRTELAWREFSYNLLQQQPRLDEVNFRRDFNGFPWRNDPAGLNAWQRGATGYPLVDAGMRELWQTGYMHNRVRMVAASFLVKHLLIDWRLGEQWFWDCLLDADPANNPANWQWVAGCGADAAPYFRIFNPLTQAEKFDPDGIYCARYIPGYTQTSPQRLQGNPISDLFEDKEQSSHSKDYPTPVVDHGFARERALEAYKKRDPEDEQ